MKKYSVKELATLANVSVRTLHHYDQIDLLKPAIRSRSQYRMYGEKELLKLQQILFLKELDFKLKQIKSLLNSSSFDLIEALESHKLGLINKQERLITLLNTLDKTLLKLKGKKMITDQELYEGFQHESVDQMREEVATKYGKDLLERSERYLKSLSKEEFMQLKQEQKDVFKQLFALREKPVESEEVQHAVSIHYHNIRKFWGTHGTDDAQKSQYKGLAQLYLSDERFTRIDKEPKPEFARFLAKAMEYFALHQL